MDQAAEVKGKFRLLEDSLESRKRLVDDLRQGVAAPGASVTVLRDLLTAAAHGDNSISRELQKLSSDFGKYCMHFIQ